MIKQNDVVYQLQHDGVFTPEEARTLGVLIHEATRNFSDADAEQRLMQAVIDKGTMVEALIELTEQISVELKKTRRRMQWFAAKYETLRERGEAMIEALERFSDAMLYGKDAVR